MRVFVEETTGAFEEILDFKIKQIFEIKEIEDQKAQEVLLEILNLSLPAQEGFEYVALIKPSSWIEIRNLRDRKSSDPFHKGDKQEIGRNVGDFMTSFWGNAIQAKCVQKFIKNCIQQTWLEMAKRSIGELSILHFDHP